MAPDSPPSSQGYSLLQNNDSEASISTNHTTPNDIAIMDNKTNDIDLERSSGGSAEHAENGGVESPRRVELTEEDVWDVHSCYGQQQSGVLISHLNRTSVSGARLTSTFWRFWSGSISCRQAPPKEMNVWPRLTQSRSWTNRCWAMEQRSVYRRTRA